MGLAKQAKTLSDKQIKLVLLHLTTTRNPTRNRVIFLLSVKSGFRAKEIASLKWKMLMNSDGQMMNEIHLTNTASKGKSSGRVITNAFSISNDFLLLTCSCSSINDFLSSL